MIEIPDAPTIQACTTCWRAVVWLWSPRTKTWVKFATEPTDTRLLRVDECRTDDHLPSWREWPVPTPDPDAAARSARGRALFEEAMNARRKSSPEGT